MKVKNAEELHKEDLKKIGDNIRKIRSDKNKTQKDLCMEVGVNKNFFSKVEKGDLSISVDILIKTARVLEVSFFDFFRDTEYVYTKASKNYIDQIEQLNEIDKDRVLRIIKVFHSTQRALNL